MISISFVGLLYLLASIIGLFSSAVLLLPASATMVPTRWLGLYLFGLALSMVMGFLPELTVLANFPWLILPLASIPFITGPALYRYIQLTHMTPSQFSTVTIPVALLIGLVLSWFWYMQYMQSGTLYGSAIYWLGLSFYLVSLPFALLSLLTLRRVRKQLSSVYSNFRHRKLLWPYWLCGGFLLMLGLDFSLSYILLINSQFIDIARVVLGVSFSIVIFVTALFAIRQPMLCELESQLGAKTKQKYASSGLDKDNRERLAKRLHAYMSVHKVFLEQDLTLSYLAELMTIKSHHLSQVLNQELDITFYDYINRYRIEYAKACLANSNSSVTDVVYSSGYNNKTSFYKAFKQIEGLTPMQYRNRVKT